MSLPRRLAAVAAGSFAVASLVACSPVLTHEPYAASDGVRVTWDEGDAIRAENVLLVSEREGGEARVVAGLTNGGSQGADLTIGFTGGASAVVSVPAGSTVLLGGSASDEDLVLPDVPGAPGSTVSMTFSTPSQGTVEVEVPVLDGTFEEYAALLP